MKLAKLIKALSEGLELELKGSSGAEITAVVCDSRKSLPGCVFAALPGASTDGARYAAEAVEKGAVCVITERPLDVDVAQIIVPDAREALALASEAVLGRPSEGVTLVGVTGTNGKTTVTYLLEGIINSSGGSPGTIGTVNYRYSGKTFTAEHTTPEAPDLSGLLKEMREAGTTHCVMEVSSHALAQKRVHALAFDAAVFTNLTHEHLDYHRTMEEYYRCKSLLFTGLLKPGAKAVVNVDDPWGAKLAASLDGCITTSTKPGASVYPENCAFHADGIEARVMTPVGAVEVKSPLVGEYNLHNILSAVGAAVSIGISPRDVEMGIGSVARVPGRLERVETGGLGFRAFVDYAHTGDALERALGALGELAEGRIITVFGCGGNRDKAKRPVMARAAARLSDISIITSDNPRDEDPEEIIRDVERGMDGVERFAPDEDLSRAESGYTAIADRREAIRKALATARKGDTVLVAGKGHEDYQIVRGRKIRFSDFEVLDECVRTLGKTA